MSTRSEKSAAAQEEIMTAALGLFAKKGFKGTTIRDVSGASGRSMGCIYHHFSGKEDLFERLIMSQDILPGLEKAGLLFFAPGFPDNLGDIALEVRNTIASQRERIMLWYVDALEFSGRYARKVIQTSWPAMDMALRGAFARVEADTITETLDPVMAMRIIISAFMGIFMQEEILGIHFTDSRDDGELIEQASTLFLHGLKKG